MLPRERDILIRKLGEIDSGIARDLEENQPELFRHLTVFGFVGNPWRFWRWKEIKRKPAV